MKTFPTMAFLFLTSFCFGQTVSADKINVSVTVHYRPADVELIKGENHISFIRTPGGRTTFTGLETDYYSFLIGGRGQLSVQTDSILVQKGQQLVLDITLNGPCLYDRPADQTPTCPENHTDNIIPIVYGFIAQAADSKNDEIRLGGCIVTDCDPKYYCKRHQIEF